MTNEIWVMCGVPGCGKSTYAERACNRLLDKYYSCVVISRDEIRKKYIKHLNEYFDYEGEVYKEFIRQINEAIKLGINYVIVDATHLSKGSRAKLLTKIVHPENVKLVFKIIDCGLDRCLERNAKRTGFARVPDHVIKNMHEKFKMPTMTEFNSNNYGFEDIIIDYYKEGD